MKYDAQIPSSDKIKYKKKFPRINIIFYYVYALQIVQDVTVYIEYK